MTNFEKLAALRSEMKQHQVDAYLVSSADPHISEYLPERYKTMAWLSGFTGSAGTLLITQDFAGLWTDSRYFVQANEQLEGTGFELVKLKQQHAPEYVDWAMTNLPKGAVLAFNGKLTAAQLAQTLQSKLHNVGILTNGELDLFEKIWQDRPNLPKEKAFLLKESQTGQTTESKIEAIRQKMAENFTDTHIISTLDDLAWTLNIRGSDVQCNPVVLGFLLITLHDAELFIDQSKLDDNMATTLRAEGVSISDYVAVWKKISSLPTSSNLLIDPKKNCYTLYANIPSHTKIIESTNPSTLLKAIKNEKEIELTRKTMIKDGVALTKFFKWIEEELDQIEMSEISIAERLREFRAEQTGFVGESFDTIAGYQAHGALPHYKATPKSNSKLEKSGLLLIDSGGQYLSGTTDITRVISLGDITKEEKIDYTLVLKGMIDGSTSKFPRGTRGYQIDAITRKPLWDQLRNYGHGTGHGVGFFLNVHEGPQVFNVAAIDIPIDTGMITSIEPGLYREGKYGIRIENLVLSEDIDQNIFGEFLTFETLTLCYISTDLIDKTILDKHHISWLNQYHQLVYDKLSPHLNEPEKIWLQNKTKAI